MSEQMIKSKEELVERLVQLTRGFQFRGGEPTNCGNDYILFAIDRLFRKNGSYEYLASIVARAPLKWMIGIPWVVRRLGQSEVLAYGETDHLGTFRFSGLPEGDYTLEIGKPVQ